jgi:hypothetical protein
MTEKIFKTQIYKPEDFVGKTIKAIYDLKPYTYIYFESSDIVVVGDGFPYIGQESGEFNLDDAYLDKDSKNSIDRLIALGYITKDQYNQFNAEYPDELKNTLS